MVVQLRQRHTVEPVTKLLLPARDNPVYHVLRSWYVPAMSDPAFPETVIETARLRLRAYRDAELADLVALAGPWDVAAWMTNLPHPYTEADGRGWIGHVRQAHAVGRPRSFAVALKGSPHHLSKTAR